MADTIEQAKIDTFSSNIILLSQQKTSKLENTVRRDIKTEGTATFFERWGSSETEEVTALADNSPDMTVANDRRMLSWQTYGWGKLLGINDPSDYLIDPKSAYTQVAAAAVGRRKDERIVNALGGTAYEGHAGGTPVTFPGAYQIAAGATGLTLAKLYEAKRLFMYYDVDPDVEDITVLISEYQATKDLPAIAEWKSFEFNVNKPIADGTLVSRWMGMNWIVSNKLAKPAADRYCYVYCKSGMGASVRSEWTKVENRADKRFRWYIYTQFSVTASRIEDCKVLQMLCTEV